MKQLYLNKTVRVSDACWHAEQTVMLQLVVCISTRAKSFYAQLVCIQPQWDKRAQDTYAFVVMSHSSQLIEAWSLDAFLLYLIVSGHRHVNSNLLY